MRTIEAELTFQKELLDVVPDDSTKLQAIRQGILDAVGHAMNEPAHFPAWVTAPKEGVRVQISIQLDDAPTRIASQSHD